MLVAVLDTGVDLRHPDLKDRVVVKQRADIIDPEASDGPQDENSHGTHVAGIIAATANNGLGIAGTAPRARLLPVRVLNENANGSLEGIASGIRYATKHKADVINLSLSTDPVGGWWGSATGQLTSLRDAISDAWNAGAVVVASAGNYGFPLCGEPAASEHVVCVGAVDAENNLASYSNFDATTFETYLVAPGGEGRCEEGIISTFLREADTSGCVRQAGYEYYSGTSMAAPFVSGVAALLSSEGLANEEIVVRLRETATDLGPAGPDPHFGSGLVNASRAVAPKDG